MYCYSFVLVNRENQESLDNYKRSICVSFSACLGNGVASPLHWPTPAELVLFNNTLLMKNWEKDPTFQLIYPVLETQNCFFVIFLNGYMFDLRFSWTDFMDINHRALLEAMSFMMSMSCFFKLLRLQVKNVLLSPKNINSHGFSLQSFEIIVSLKLIEMWTVMFT